MRIATWNVNSIRARKERVLDWLNTRKPDVLCLQETKTTDDKFPVDDFSKLGYQVTLHGQKTYNGVAICSRHKITATSKGFDDGVPDEQARLICATICGIHFISAYIPNGQSVGSEKYTFKLDWMNRLRSFLDRRFNSRDSVVLCGDFNVAPEDRDVYDPIGWRGSILCSEAERNALAHIVDWGLVDSLRYHKQDAGLYSWWDYRQLGFPKNRGLRIDHIYLSEPLVSRCVDSSIDREARKGKQPSDHAPVLAQLACENRD